MKGKTAIHRRFAAIAICFAIVFGAVANFGVFDAIAGIVTKKSFYVDFADLAGEVTDTQYNGGDTYISAESDATINNWVNTYFDLSMSRGAAAVIDREYLGQDSQSIFNDSSYGRTHRWVIDKNGYLLHTAEWIGGEMLRRGDALTLKYGDALARMQDFEATVVFNTKADDLGSVYITFHEETAGQMMTSGNVEGVFVGNGNNTYRGTGPDGVLVKKSGSTVGNNKIADTEYCTTALAANTDYKLFVKSQGTTLTVKVLAMDNTELYNKTTENAVTARAGYVSVGVTNGNRAIKSIEVKEFDENGNQVNFGTTVKKNGPVIFDADFDALNAYLTDADYTNGLHRPGNTTSASDTNINKWISDRFSLYHNRENRGGPRDYIGQSALEIDNSYGESATNGGDHYFQIDKEGYLQHTATVTWWEMLRKGDTLTAKHNGETLTLKNFEASLVFNTEANALGSVYILFHEQDPGKFSWAAGANTSIAQDAVIIGNGSGFNAVGASGITVKKSGAACSNMTIATAFDTNLAANTDYELYIKVIGTTLTVKISTADGKTVIYEKTTTGEISSAAGSISIGTTNATRSFASFTVKELDEHGKQVDLGTSMAPVADVDTYKVDFADLTAVITAAGDSFNQYGLYRSTSNDSAADKWIDERFTMYSNNEGHSFAERVYLGESPIQTYKAGGAAAKTYKQYWSPHNSGYLRMNIGGDLSIDGMLRNIELLSVKDALLRNFEAKMTFKLENLATTWNNVGGVVVVFHETGTSGKFSYMSTDADMIVVGGGREKVTDANNYTYRQGFRIKKADVTLSDYENTALSSRYPDHDVALAAQVEYTLYLKVVNGDLTVAISDSNGNVVQTATTYEDAVSDEAGGISFGISGREHWIKSFEITELDESGDPVDYGTLANPEEHLKKFEVDFADAAAKVASGSYNSYGLYSSVGTDAVDTWIAERFTMYSSREGHTFSARAYLGQKPLNGENKHWQVHNTGYLRMGGGFGDGMLRTVELLTVKDGDSYAKLKNFEMKLGFKLNCITTNNANQAGGIVVTFHDNGATPGKLDWDNAAEDNPDMFFVGSGFKGDANYDAFTAYEYFAGIRTKKAGETLQAIWKAYATNTANFPAEKVEALAANVDYVLKLKVVNGDLTVSIVKASDDSVVYAETKFEGAVSNQGGAISFGISNQEHWIKGVEITELDDEGNPVDLGTYRDAPIGGGSEGPVDENAMVIDFADLAAKVGAASFDASGLYTSKATDTVINDWINNRFALYYNRECRGGVRDYIGQSSADIENAYGEPYKDGGNIHYFEISKTGYLQHTCAQTGWEHFRKGDALTLKHNGDIARLQNFEAELVYNTKANALGSVYISFHEQRPGVIGWTTDAKTSIEQDAVIITNTGITVKKSGDHQGSSGANQFKNTTVETVFDPAVQANTDYKLYIKVIGTDLTVKLTTADGATTVHEKQYTNAVSSAAGAFSIGTTNSTRSFKKLIVTELDDEGASVPMGSAMKPLGVDGFKVDFAELALKVDEAKFDASTGLYTSTVADTAINSWVAERFDLFYSRENRAWSVRDYLGQSSVDIENAYGEPYKDGAGNAHYFQIDKKGYLQHTTTGIGGEMLRKGDALIIKHGGKAATLKNFEATLVFNTKANRLGAVYVSFHEGTAGKFMLGGNSNAVILGNGNGTYQGNGNDGIVVKKNGTAINNNKLADTFTSALEKDTDYQLYVKVVGTTVTVKVLSADGKTTIFEKSYTNAIAEDNGFISFGTTNATRSFKSIEIAELDEFGDPVPFGTLTENGATPKIFLADFAALAGLVPEKSFNTNGAYTSSAADTAINKWVNNRFLLKYHREGHTFFDRAYLGQNSNSFNNDAGYGGNHHWEIEKGGYLLHSAQLTGGEMFRKGDALVLKSGDAAAYVENFEATVIFNTEENKLGSVYLSFHENSPGTFAWTAGGVAFAAVGNGNGSYTGKGVDGLIVKPLDKTTANNNMENADRFAEALEPNTDYKMYVKVLNNDLYVTVSTMDDAVIVSRECENAITSRGGSIAVGTTNTNRSIRFIKVVQLDQSGTPIDFGSVTKPGIDTENTVVYDFEDAAQLNNFDRYYVPEVKTEDAKAIKITGTANDTFSVNGSLKWARSPLYCTDKELADGVERDGRVWQDTFIPVYRDNVGIAVLNTRTYKNFILDVEFTANSYWPLVGFGAQGNDGEDVFYTQKGGGYTIRLESNSGGKGTMTALSGEAFAGIGTSVVDYNGYGGVHSFHIIVSNRKVYVYVDANTTAMEFDLPASYNGGYIYLASNNPGVSYDNLKITDLDAKNIEITDMVTYFDNFVLNRDEGDALNLPNRVTVRDADNHEYDLPVTSWDNDTYRSNKAGNYVFKPNMPSIKGFTYADEWNPDVSVVNNINNDYNTTTSRKYYFDHANDFKDFSAYYAQENYGGVKGKWSTYDGKLVKGEATDLWRAVGGRVTNNYNAPSRGWSGLNMSKSISTLMLNDVNLINYRVEMDYTHGPSCWYTYLICGQQDPTQFYWKESSSSSFDYATEKGLVMNSNYVIHKAGAWCMAEQEGRLNVCSGLREHPKRTYTTEDILPETHYHDTYDRSQTHHMVVTVVDGYLTMQIDHSEPFVWQLHDDVHGGLVGIASMGHGAYVSNFQVTALDYKGNEVPFDQAAEGKSFEDIFVGFDPSNRDWIFDWNKNYLFEF